MCLSIRNMDVNHFEIEGSCLIAGKCRNHRSLLSALVSFWHHLLYFAVTTVVTIIRTCFKICYKMLSGYPHRRSQLHFALMSRAATLQESVLSLRAEDWYHCGEAGGGERMEDMERHLPWQMLGWIRPTTHTIQRHSSSVRLFTLNSLPSSIEQIYINIFKG